MTDFDRDSYMRPGYGYSGRSTGAAPAWIGGMVVVVAVFIGAIAYSGHDTVPQPPLTPTGETQPPVMPAPPPETPKP
jgi:hypothetical protein